MKFLRFWFPVFLYSGIIFYVSSLPYVVTPPGVPGFDKIAHLFEYGLWAVLLARALGATQRDVTPRMLWGAVAVLSLAHGIADEYLQSFIPGRDAALFDVMADWVGGSLGGFLYARVVLKNGRV